MSHAIARVREVATLEVVPNRNARRVIAVAAFAIATALGAQVFVPLPFTPVPLTLQTLFVVLAGALLGPGLGAASQLTYLAMGVAGLPVFYGGQLGLAHLFGPTGGYLLAFPLTAFVAGLVARPSGRKDLVELGRLAAGLFLASLVVLVGGTAWLAAMTGDLTGAVALGLAPFLVGDLVKVGLAALIAWRGRDRTLGLL
ncbi:MAG: biotin transporter BioY [Gammaproteobacteria bacterium]